MEEDSYKLEQVKTHRDTALFWINLANERNGSINKHLITITGFVIPIFPLLLDLKNLTDINKMLLIFALIFLLISLISGLIQLIIDGEYFAVLSADSSLRESKWNSERAIVDIRKAVNDIPPTNSRGSEIALYFQATFLIIAFILITLLLGFILFQ